MLRSETLDLDNHIVGLLMCQSWCSVCLKSIDVDVVAALRGSIFTLCVKSSVPRSAMQEKWRNVKVTSSYDGRPQWLGSEGLEGERERYSWTLFHASHPQRGVGDNDVVCIAMYSSSTPYAPPDVCLVSALRVLHPIPILSPVLLALCPRQTLTVSHSERYCVHLTPQQRPGEACLVPAAVAPSQRSAHAYHDGRP